ncbi:MAG TPA: VWA domain-containing protein, partial [Blastocatellia bacterium]|nr:VWA domain-containing protein [Blastocatellia bacterium]
MIRKRARLVALTLFITQLVASITLSSSAQTAADKQPGAQEKPLKLRTDEVIVDAVVLDKKSHAVSDLTAGDFELYEDGVRQKITSFRFESNNASSETVTTNTNAAPGPRLMNLVALVFDAQTTRDGALLARRAALDFVESGIKPNDYVAVFGVDQNLLVLAPFTQDKAALKRAIEAFTSRESKKYNAVAGEVRQALEGLVTPLSDAEKLNIADTMTSFDAIPPEAPALTPGSRASAPNQVDPVRVTKTQILLSALKSLRTFSVYETQFQALRMVDALLAIISGQSGLQASRKT